MARAQTFPRSVFLLLPVITVSHFDVLTSGVLFLEPLFGWIVLSFDRDRAGQAVIADVFFLPVSIWSPVVPLLGSVPIAIPTSSTTSSPLIRSPLPFS